MVTGTASLRADYLKPLLISSSLKGVIEKTASFLLPFAHLYDTIVFRGMSGALVAPGVAIQLNKNLIFVRKEKNHHSTQLVEGYFDVRRYIIVDDFVDTGRTVAKIIQKLKIFQEKARCVGLYLYYNDNYVNMETYRKFDIREDIFNRELVCLGTRLTA